MNIHTYKNTAVYSPAFNCKVDKARVCQLLVHVTKENFNEAIQAYKEAGFCKEFQGLYIDGNFDLSFLEEFPMMLYLEVKSEKPISTKSIEALTNLRGLRLSKQKTGLDFSNFNQLEFFTGDWHDGNHGLRNCKLLKDLCFQTY